MNNQFTKRVSDIIMYSKEEANRLRTPYIGPEHLLLGLLRNGEGKAIEALFNLQIDLKKLKEEVEKGLLEHTDNGLNYNEINDSIQLKNIKVEQIEDNLLINGKIKIY